MSDDPIQAINDLCAKGNDYLTATTRDRPYDGQPHTAQGERGKTEVKDVTFRDVCDCIVIGAFDAGAFDLAEEGKSRYDGTIHDLSWEKMDPLAMIQNAMCELEERMGIYPNVPKLERVEDEGDK